MIDWFVDTLRSYPEIAIFLSLPRVLLRLSSPTRASASAR